MSANTDDGFVTQTRNEIKSARCGLLTTSSRPDIAKRNLTCSAVGARHRRAPHSISSLMTTLHSGLEPGAAAQRRVVAKQFVLVRPLVTIVLNLDGPSDDVLARARGVNGTSEKVRDHGELNHALAPPPSEDI